MKKAVLWTLCLLTVLTACTRVDKVLPRASGTWLVSELKTEAYLQAELQWDTIMYDHATIFFENDGNGSVTDKAGGVLEISWTYDNQANLVTLVYESGVPNLEATVLESERDRQLWFSNEVNRVGGQDFTYEYTYTLRRQD